jgi:hypothetical protein
MARPLKLGVKLEGEDAINFLDEMDRVESLKPEDKEYAERKKYFEHCRRLAKQVGAV